MKCVIICHNLRDLLNFCIFLTHFICVQATYIYARRLSYRPKQVALLSIVEQNKLFVFESKYKLPLIYYKYNGMNSTQMITQLYRVSPAHFHAANSQTPR